MASANLPADIEAEEGALSAIMQGGPSAIGQAVRVIGYESKRWFTVPAYWILYDELVTHYEDGQPIELTLFTGRLRDSGRLSEIGGDAELTRIWLRSIPAMLDWFLTRLADKRWLRFVIQTATRIGKTARENQDNLELVVRETEDALLQIVNRNQEKAAQLNIKQIVHDVLEKLESKEGVLGISTGFANLDELIGGLAPAAKIVLAGQISGGKSAFVQCLAHSLSVERGIPVALFSFEMPAEQVVQRLIQIGSGISTRSIARGEATMFDHDAYANAGARIASAPLHIICERLDIRGINARCLQLKPRVVIIDYIQIVPEPRGKNESRTDQLDRMSSATKQMAMAMGSTVIELSQLTEHDGKLMTRGSKSIIADADILLAIEGEDDPEKTTILKQIRAAKNREGARKPIDFMFNKPITRFREGRK